MTDGKLSKIYYSPKCYWKGVSAIDKLAKEGGVSKEKAREFLKKQTLWQIYLPAPKYNYTQSKIQRKCSQ